MDDYRGATIREACGFRLAGASGAGQGKGSERFLRMPTRTRGVQRFMANFCRARFPLEILYSR